MKSFVRKLAFTGGAAVVLLTAGGVATSPTTVHAAGPTAAHCAIKGTATISPGLGAPPGGPQTFNYSGQASCHGVVAGATVNDGGSFNGTISGTGTCTSGNLVSCLQTSPPSISCGVSDDGTSISGNGTYVQAGANITVECSGTDSGGGSVVIEADAVFTPSPAVQNPVSSVTFTGTATAHTS